MWLVYSKKNDYVTDSRFSWSTKNLPVMKEGSNCLCRRAYWEWAARYELPSERSFLDAAIFSETV
jgi:hypothetical protein